VPTAASHDGVVFLPASIQKDGEKVSIGAQTPIAVIMDTGVIAESPFRLLASGCGTSFSNLAAVKDWLSRGTCGMSTSPPMRRPSSELAARLVIENAPTIKAAARRERLVRVQGPRVERRRDVDRGILAPGLGSEHKFSHALDRIAKKPALHGEQCGVGRS